MLHYNYSLIITTLLLLTISYSTGVLTTLVIEQFSEHCLGVIHLALRERTKSTLFVNPLLPTTKMLMLHDHHIFLYKHFLKHTYNFTPSL